MKHRHATLIKAWADGAKIQYLDSYSSQWMNASTPDWKPTTEYRLRPANCTATIEEGIITLEDGTCIDLKWIQGLLNEAYVCHGHQDFATGANLMAKVTGMVQGPHEEWYVTTPEE